jgi:hypothetical protein
MAGKNGLAGYGMESMDVGSLGRYLTLRYHIQYIYRETILELSLV